MQYLDLIFNIKHMPRPKKYFSPGCVFQRNNKLYIKFGNQQIRTGYNATKEGWDYANQMKDELYKKIQEDEGNLPHTNNKIEVYAAFDLFMEHLTRKQRSHNTIRGYQLAVKTFFPVNQTLNHGQIKTAVNFFLDRQGELILTSKNNDATDNSDNEKSLSDVSINTYLNKLQIFLNFCIEEGLIGKINVYKIFKKELDVTSKSPYSEDELESIYKKAEEADREFYLILKFMELTGSRISEALLLTWDRINLSKGEIIFSNKINQKKTDKFPITKAIEVVLLELKEISEKRTDKSKSAKVFKWESSSSSRLSRRLTKIESGLGIKLTKQSFHRLRNTFSNRILTSNLSVIQVRDLMRHKDIRTTLNHYKQYDTEKLRMALENL